MKNYFNMENILNVAVIAVCTLVLWVDAQDKKNGTVLLMKFGESNKQEIE